MPAVVSVTSARTRRTNLVGVLGMQFHNAGNYPEVRKSLDLMDSWIPAWNGSTPHGVLPE